MNKSILLMAFGLMMFTRASAHVALVYPNGGETFVSGEIVNIQWEIVVEHNTLNWDLYLSMDGGDTWNPLKLDISVDSLNYHWEVPDTPTNTAQIRVVMDNGGGNYMDNSDNFSIATITGINESTGKLAYRVFPNPMLESAVLTFENPANDSFRLVLYNATGQIVMLINNQASNRFLIERKGLKSGMYFFRLFGKNEVKASGKLMIR